MIDRLLAIVIALCWIGNAAAVLILVLGSVS